MADWHFWIGAFDRSMLVADWHLWIGEYWCLDQHAWIGVLLVVLGSKFQREEFLAVLGSALFSLCLDRSYSYRAWIGVSDGIERAPCLDRSFKEEFGIERESHEWRERV